MKADMIIKNAIIFTSDERKILDWERTYFLTKYYCI